MHMVLKNFDKESTVLIPDVLEMLAPTELTQYYIKDWQLIPFDEGKNMDICNQLSHFLKSQEI